MRVCEQILELARWAPSGDNTQPWRFEIIGDHDVVVHGFDTRAHCVYDLDGHPSQMALGALLETMCIAATGYGCRSEVSRRMDMSETSPTFDVRFVPDASVSKSPFIPAITTRAVQRRPLSTAKLSDVQKATLEASVAPSFQVVWFESLTERWEVAKLLFRNARLRLTMPEAFEVHRSVIDWGARYSEDKIPEQAVGVDPLTAKLMRWAMQSWSRVSFLNTWLGGTIMPRLQLDLVPGLRCGAHVALVARESPVTVDHYVESGAALQRFWLQAELLDLRLQPEMTPVIFSRYQRENRVFTVDEGATAQGTSVFLGFNSLLGSAEAERVVFFARLGQGAVATSRSTRLPLSSLKII